MKNENKLNQLTSLRFFAAFMIVLHHSLGLFGTTPSTINLGQGVSFFFVLSGFILRYVYPKLDTFSEIKSFWKARIARIWPAYLASSVLGFFLMDYVWRPKIAIPYLLMIQSWLPFSSFFFAYNALAWSISTEIFFYLVFPFILFRFNKYWPLYLTLSISVLLSLFFIANKLQLPIYLPPTTGMAVFKPTIVGLIYINPLSRIFEFIFGMVLATLWKKTKWETKSSWATLIEIVAIAICVVAVCSENYFLQLVNHLHLGKPMDQWSNHVHSFFAFGLLIYVMALGKGQISRLLATPLLVLLGEISFSLYLIHQIIILSYARYLSNFTNFPNWLTLTLLYIILLVLSFLMWRYIEVPCKKILLSRKWFSADSTKILRTPSVN